MADFEVKKKPEFSSTARKLETTDRAHADLFNDLYQKMFDNDNYLKQNVESKAEKDGGDIANTKVSEFAEETEQFPVPDPGEASKTLWGKMKKFVEDFKAWCTGVCLIGHIVNNCTSTANNLPLAAAQGKALMDLYTQLYSDLQTINNKFINSITDVNIKKLPFTGDRGFIIGIYGHSSINKPDDGGGIIIAWKYSNTNIQARALSNTGFIFKCNYDYPNWVIV